MGRKIEMRSERFEEQEKPSVRGGSGPRPLYPNPILRQA